MTERGLETLLLKEAEVERLLNRLGGFLNEIGFGHSSLNSTRRGCTRSHCAICDALDILELARHR